MTVIWLGLLRVGCIVQLAGHGSRARSRAIDQRTDLRDERRLGPGRWVRSERRDPDATLGHDRPSAELETQRPLVRLNQS